jgi:ABC-type branched-subunit amino acid transport system ATPase component
LPGLTVHDNLLLGWYAADPSRQAGAAREIEAVLELFPVLRERLAQDCSTLSGGEMQMLAIARALLAKPRVLLLDEPSLGLAPQMIARVYTALRELLHRGLSMVLVEQKAVPLRGDKEATIVLQNGRTVFQESRRPSTDELATLYLGQKAAV